MVNDAVPVLQALAEDPSARALFLFPTKALGQDQVAEFGELVQDAGLEVSSACYDGDTPAPIRSAIRTAGQVVVTNPDMLHSAILPHHTKWFQLFEQLRVIVIDELHTYRGVFGSHVANVLRRLLRLCAHYGSNPVIVCCSATIGNPAELAETLTGRPVRSLAGDDRTSQVPGEPPCARAALPDYGEASAPASSARRFGAAFRPHHGVGPHDFIRFRSSLTRPVHSLCTLRSQGRPRTTQHSVPAASTLCRVGMFTYWVPQRSFYFLMEASPPSRLCLAHRKLASPPLDSRGCATRSDRRDGRARSDRGQESGSMNMRLPACS